MTPTLNHCKYRRRTSLLLALALIVSLFTGMSGTAAWAATSDDIQDELDELNSQKNEIQGRMDAIQAEIDSLDYEKANTLEKKLILDQKNLLAQEELDVIQEQIDIIDNKLANLQSDLDNARAEEAYQKERFLARVRAMEENSSAGYMDVLFNVSSLTDLLTRLDLVNEVMSYDEHLEDEYVAARERVETLEAEAETMFADNEAHRQELETKKVQLQTDIDAACALMAQMDQDTADYEAVLAQEEATQAELEAVIMEKEKELAEARAKEEAARLAALAAQQAAAGASAAAVSYVADGTSWMMWPSYTSVLTSSYGMRTNPVSGVYKLHAGCDVGSSYGSAIWAAAGGTVISAGWNGGYGNCVMINHGNGYTTVYGHMSRIAVSSGQTVSMGQVVGYVGSTGNSTGPHLHFEVRASATATPINPMAFSYLT